MPIAKVQLPDGRIGRFDVAEGTTPAEVEAFVATQFPQQQESRSLVEQIPGKEPGVQPTPEPTGGIWDKVRAALMTTARTGLGMATAPVAAASALVTHGLKGPNVAAEQFRKNIERVVGTPSTPLEQQYTENVGSVMNELAPTMGLTGELGSLARSQPGRAAQYAAKSVAGSGTPLREAVINPSAQVAGAALKVPAKGIKNFAAFMASKNPDTLTTIYEAAKAGDRSAVEAMRGLAPVDKTLMDAKLAIEKIQQNMYEGYRTAKEGWAADRAPLNFKSIDDEFARLQGTVEQHGHSLIGKEEQAKIAQVSEVLNEWRSDSEMHNTVGLDALKRRIDAIYPDSPRQTQAQRVITGTRNAVKDTIVNQSPDYAEAMKSYEEQFAVIKDIQQALSLGDKVAKDTAIKRLGTLAKRNQDFRMAMAEEMKKRSGIDIGSQVAGHEMSSWMPEAFGKINAFGLGGMGLVMSHPGLAAGIPLTSPRILGELAHGAGRVAGAAKRISPAIQKVLQQ